MSHTDERASDLEKHDAIAPHDGKVIRMDDKQGEALIEDLARAGHTVAFDAHGHALVQLDPIAERKLRTRIDLCLMPLIMLMYLWCFLDRTNIGNARLYGLEKDLGMTGYDYNTSLTIFYVAYVLLEFPSNLLCKVIGPGRWLPFLVFGFGLCSLLTSVVHDFSSLCAVRFFLGAFEAGLFPGIAYALTRWYRKDELAFRLSLYIAMAPLAGAFGGLLAYGIVNDLTHIGWLTSWRMLFFIEGLVTCVVGIATFFLLADAPATARWLSPEQKALAEARLKTESPALAVALEKMHKETVWSGVKNVNAFVLGFVFLFNSMTVQGIAVFLPTIVAAQYPADSAVTKNLLTAPPYVVGMFMVLLLNGLAWRFRQRGIFCLIAAPLAAIGFILFMFAPNANGQYTGAFFVAMGSFPYGALTNAWIAANVSPDAARASGIGLAAILQNIGGLISSWLYLPSQAPHYYQGHSINLASAIIQFTLCAGLIIYQKRENRLREAGARDYRLEGKSEEEIAILGHRHPLFRLTY